MHFMCYEPVYACIKPENCKLDRNLMKEGQSREIKEINEWLVWRSRPGSSSQLRGEKRVRGFGYWYGERGMHNTTVDKLLRQAFTAMCQITVYYAPSFWKVCTVILTTLERRRPVVHGHFGICAPSLSHGFSGLFRMAVHPDAHRRFEIVLFEIMDRKFGSNLREHCSRHS